MVGVNELKEIAIKCGTPSYIFDTDELCARIDAMQQILGCGVTVCYAMKANPFLISVLDKKLDKFEVCSPGGKERYPLHDEDRCCWNLHSGIT